MKFSIELSRREVDVLFAAARTTAQRLGEGWFVTAQDREAAMELTRVADRLEREYLQWIREGGK